MESRFSFALSMTLLGGCSSSEANKDVVKDPVYACVERGVDYFKSIRSYPTLHSDPNVGRGAEEVALERCQRDLGAF